MNTHIPPRAKRLSVGQIERRVAAVTAIAAIGPIAAGIFLGFLDGGLRAKLLAGAAIGGAVFLLSLIADRRLGATATKATAAVFLILSIDLMAGGDKDTGWFLFAGAFWTSIAVCAITILEAIAKSGETKEREAAEE